MEDKCVDCDCTCADECLCGCHPVEADWKELMNDALGG